MAPKTMTPEHKAAMAEGRAQGRAVRAYLEALDAHKPKRGRRRTPEAIEARIIVINATVADADPLARLQMLQERIDLQAALDAANQHVDWDELEAAFVAHAAAYGNRKGISYAAWRETGVPAEILKRAGIGRSRKPAP